MQPKEFSPGDIVKVLSVENRDKLLIGFRYGVVVGPATKKIKDNEIAGYEILVGSKIEWYSGKTLLTVKSEDD